LCQDRELSWATPYIEQLKAGRRVQFRPRGNSMAPKIHSGALCTVEPIAEDRVPGVGEIVLCKLGGKQYLHLIKAVQGPRFQIGNNRGGINGWITATGIYGRLVSVDA
jgi:hypothetical protein